jgi:hypothetical protein
MVGARLNITTADFGSKRLEYFLTALLTRFLVPSQHGFDSSLVLRPGNSPLLISFARSNVSVPLCAADQLLLDEKA